MNYKQLVEAYLRLDFKLELFKTVMQTMVAVSIIYINNLKAPKCDYENRKNKLSVFSMSVITLMLTFTSVFFSQKIENEKYLVGILFAGIVTILGMLIDRNKKERKLEFILKVIDDKTFIKHI